MASQLPGQRPESIDAQPAAEGASAVNATMMLVCLCGLGYIVLSAGLISYNKFLMTEDRFPYAICLVLLHAIFCSTFAFFLYLVKPSLFPSLTDPAKKVTVDADLIFRGAMPIAIFFSAQLVLSNTAYLHSSVAFLQMMKEANLVLVYTFSLIAALEKFSWRSIGILVFVILATTLTIHGEVNFSMTGFIIQGSGQVFESLKIVLQAMLLSNAGRKLDALTYVMLVMPLCAVCLGAGIGLLTIFPHEHFLIPEMHHLVQWWPHLLANSCIAFMLNVVVALFIKYSTAVAFILAGIVKDAMIVATSALVLKEVITVIQGIGFALQLCAILVWSMIKTFPERFEAGIMVGLGSFLFPGEPIKGKVQQYGSTEEASSSTSKC
jgi:hypothetical protein